MKMNAQAGGLNPKQQKFLDELIRTGSVTRAAAEAGVSQPTAWRYQQLPEFKREYRKARLSMVERSFAVAQHTSAAIMQILFDIARDDEQPVFARIAACNALRDHAVRGVEVVDHEERLAEVEAQLKEIDESSPKKGGLRAA
jgi:phage terminase small subunit